MPSLHRFTRINRLYTKNHTANIERDLLIEQYKGMRLVMFDATVKGNELSVDFLFEEHRGITEKEIQELMVTDKVMQHSVWSKDNHVVIAPWQLFEPVEGAPKIPHDGMVGLVRLPGDYTDYVDVGDPAVLYRADTQTECFDGAVHLIKRVRICDMDETDLSMIRMGAYSPRTPEHIAQIMQRAYGSAVTVETPVTLIVVRVQKQFNRSRGTPFIDRIRRALSRGYKNG